MKIQTIAACIVLSTSNLAFAEGISWCKVTHSGNGCSHGVNWRCDCNGTNCAQDVPVTTCSFGHTGCPMGAPTSGLTVDRTLCTGISCQAPGDACGDVANSCDTSACKANDNPSPVTLQPNPSDPLTGTLLNVPVCIPKRGCSASMGDSKIPGEVCRAIGFERNGGTREIGDPVEVDTRHSTHAHVDISLPTLAGRFNFTRMYTSSIDFWKQGDGFQDLAPPFGPSEADQETLNWSHSLFSFVRVLGSANCTVRVRRGDGSIVEFSGCATPPAFMEPDGAALELGLSLKHEWSGYTLFDGDRRYTYDYEHGSIFLLGSINDWQVNASRPAIATITYEDYGCGPTIGSVNVANQYDLVFNYTQLNSAACVLSSIDLDMELVTYTYSGDSLESAIGPDFDEGYTYPVSSGSTFQVSNFGAARSSHSYVNGLVTSLAESWDGTNYFTRDEYVGDDCGELTSCMSSRFYYRRYVSYVGDGTRTAAAAIPYSVVGRYSDNVLGFRGTGSSEPGRSGAWAWSDNEPLATVAKGPTTTTVGGVSQERIWALNPEPTPAPPQRVTTSTVDGITTTFAWTSGDSAAQPSSKTPLLLSSSRDSVLSGTKKRKTLYRWNTATNFLEAELHTGLTREYTTQGGWKSVDRVVATFYKSTPECSGDPTDPLGRVTEIHGPCLVASETSTRCDLEQTFLVRSFSFDASRPNNLTQARVFPSANWASGSLVCGDSLDTTYSGHNKLGAPTLVQGPDGIATDILYRTDGRVFSLERGGHLWSYAYDADKLTAVHSPDGYWKTWCYRSYSASAGCDYTSALRTQPSAFAISDNQKGTDPSELMTYQYAPDGTLIGAAVSDAEGQQRTLSYERDPNGDLTFSGLGQGSVGGKQISLFDSAHRLRGTSAPGKPNAPPFCGGASATGAPLSAECLAFEWEGRRLTRAIGGSVGDTGLTYEAGHLSSVKTELGSASPRTNLEYTYDDFDNVLTATTHTYQGQTLVTEMEYDAQGNVVRRQNPEMRAAGATLESDFDGLGRLRSMTRRTSGGQADVLLRQEWDSTSLASCATCSGISAACTPDNHRPGRLAYREDAVGETWFNYDAHGRISAEIVRERYASSCSPERGRSYWHSPEGELAKIVYPFGREVNYIRTPPLRRPTSVSVSIMRSGSWDPLTVIDDIHWEPFGGLRYYRARPEIDQEPITVDYRAGQTAQHLTSPALCAGLDGLEDSDFTGRVRRLMVKRGSASASYEDRLDGDHVFSSTYSYAEGSQLRQRLSCLLGDGNPVMETFEFFSNDALGAARRYQEPNHDILPGRRSYDLGVNGYDAGTQNQPWHEVSTISMDWPAQQWSSTDPMFRTATNTEYGYRVDFVDPNMPETLTEQRWVGPNGEVAQRDAMQSSGFRLWTETLNGAIASGATGGLESVYQSVQTEAGLFEYYYDGTNRRRLKVYPSRERDEFYYRPGSFELLSDVGNDEVFAPRAHPVDDYVWLDGKPVVIIRGQLDLNYVRLDDMQGECGRNGAHLTPTGIRVGAECGLFFPVTDPQGRIAVMLDDNRRVAGLGESDAYGSVNQTELIASTDHPYSPYYHLQFPHLLTDFAHYPWAMDETEIRTRVHFFGVDVEATDDAWLEDGAKGLTLTSALDYCFSFGGSNCGDNMGRVTTPWVESAEYGHGPMNLRFRSGPSTSRPYWGVAADRIEYLRSERDAKPWWPPLRFPGQYWDEETGLFENWNRYYDPSIGRYLSPEPLLQSPAYVRRMAKSGMSVPTYAYAANNPLRYIDPTGLDLHVAWSNYVFSNAQDVAKLQRVVDKLNAPSGACKCALTSGTGYESTPWANRWISVVFDPYLTLLDYEGWTDPLSGIIYVLPSLDERTLAGVIAHEGGHLRWPYLGHGDRSDRFDTPQSMCSSEWKSSEAGYLKSRPWCDCP